MIFRIIFCSLLLAFFIPLLLLANIEGEFSLNFIMMYCVVIWCVMRPIQLGLKGKRRLTLMCFYIFMYVFLGVQPLLSVWSNVFPHTEMAFPPELVNYSIILVMIGIAFFEIGYFRIRPTVYDGPSPEKPNLSTTYRPTVSVTFLWIAIIIVTTAVGLSIMRYGPNIYLALRDGGFSVGEFSGPERSQIEDLLVIFGFRGLSAVLLFTSLYLWKVRHTSISKDQFLRLKVAIIYLIFLNIIVSNPLNAPRLWSGSVILTALFISLQWKGPRSFIKWYTAACVVLLLLFSGTDPRRIFGQQLMRGEDITLGNTFTEIGRSISMLPADGNFDAFQMIGYTTRYTEMHGYSMGYQMLLPALFWVPRSVWPTKPIGTPDIVAENADFIFLNVSSPLWGEGYINFGIFGVMLFLFVFGRGARFFDDKLSRLAVKPAFETIISCFFAANTFILLRGDLTSGTMYLQLVIGVTFLIQRLVKKPSRTVTAAGTERLPTN